MRIEEITGRVMRKAYLYVNMHTEGVYCHAKLSDLTKRIKLGMKNQHCLMFACATSEGPDPPAHSCRRILAFTVRAQGTSLFKRGSHMSNTYLTNAKLKHF